VTNHPTLGECNSVGEIIAQERTAKMHYLALLRSQRQVSSYLCMEKSIQLSFVCYVQNPI